jgi:DNA-binding NarL/FixJ family response regulator
LTPNEIPVTPRLHQPKLSILVACSSPPLRGQLRALLNRDPAFCLCGEADTGEAVLDLFFRCRPDVVLVDACLEERNGFKVMACIKQAIPSCQAVLLCHSTDPCVEEASRMAGANYICRTGGELNPVLAVLHKLALAKSGEAGQQGVIA